MKNKPNREFSGPELCRLKAHDGAAADDASPAATVRGPGLACLTDAPSLTRHPPAFCLAGAGREMSADR